jgi:hypothetical protein
MLEKRLTKSEDVSSLSALSTVGSEGKTYEQPKFRHLVERRRYWKR